MHPTRPVTRLILSSSTICKVWWSNQCWGASGSSPFGMCCGSLQDTTRCRCQNTKTLQNFSIDSQVFSSSVVAHLDLIFVAGRWLQTLGPNCLSQSAHRPRHACQHVSGIPQQQQGSSSSSARCVRLGSSRSSGPCPASEAADGLQEQLAQRQRRNPPVHVAPTAGRPTSGHHWGRHLRPRLCPGVSLTVWLCLPCASNMGPAHTYSSIRNAARPLPHAHTPSAASPTPVPSASFRKTSSRRAWPTTP